MDYISDRNSNDIVYQKLVEKISKEVISQILTREDKLKNMVKESIIDIYKK